VQSSSKGDVHHAGGEVFSWEEHVEKKGFFPLKGRLTVEHSIFSVGNLQKAGGGDKGGFFLSCRGGDQLFIQIEEFSLELWAFPPMRRRSSLKVGERKREESYSFLSRKGLLYE